MGRPGFPKTLKEFRQKFSIDIACWVYLANSGTHHGVDPKYLQAYLDEFVFSFNRRKTPMAAFQTLLGITGNKSPRTLGQMVQP